MFHMFSLKPHNVTLTLTFSLKRFILWEICSLLSVTPNLWTFSEKSIGFGQSIKIDMPKSKNAKTIFSN